MLFLVAILAASKISVSEIPTLEVTPAHAFTGSWDFEYSPHENKFTLSPISEFAAILAILLICPTESTFIKSFSFKKI